MLDDTKYRLLTDRFQLLELELSGHLRQSCETLLPLSELAESIPTKIPFFAQHWRVWQRLDIGQSLRFHDVCLEREARRIQADVQVRLCHEDEQTFFRFLIEDRTAFYDEQHQYQAQQKNEIEGQRLELLNEILELKQQKQQLQNSADRLKNETHEQFWALWHARTAPLFALAEHCPETQPAYGLELLQHQLEAHLKGVFPAAETVFRPAAVWAFFQHLWNAHAELQGFATTWETAHWDETTRLRGNLREWQSWLMAIFVELLRQRRTVTTISGIWQADSAVFRLHAQGDFRKPLRPLTHWKSQARYEQHPDALYLDFPLRHPAKSFRVPRVLFCAEKTPHNAKVFGWIEAETKGAVWCTPRDKTKNSENFDLLITENNENPYISTFNPVYVWQWQPADKPIRRAIVQAYLSPQNARSTMIPNQSLDLSYIREIVDDQPEMMLNLLGILEKNLEEYPEKMQREWQEGALAALRETAHKFKSCTAYTNLEGFNQALSRIESSDENGMSTEEIKAHVDAVVEVSENILEQVRQSMAEIR